MNHILYANDSVWDLKDAFCSNCELENQALTLKKKFRKNREKESELKQNTYVKN